MAASPQRGQRIRVEAPAELEPLQIAQAIADGPVLIKAEYAREHSRTWRLYKPMGELQVYEVDAYRKLTARMLDAVREYVEREIVLGRLGKADDPEDDDLNKPRLTFVTPAQLEHIKQIIGDYHEAFVAGMVNTDLLDNDTYHRLVHEGVLPQDRAYIYQPRPRELPPEAKRPVRTAYQYGRKLAREDPRDKRRLHEMGMGDMEDAVEDQPPLSRQEQEAIRFVEQHKAEYVRGLGNRVAAEAGGIITDKALEMRHKDTITDRMAQGIERRDTWREIVSEIGHSTDDWARDYERIAATEKQRAMQQGTVAALIDKHGDPDDTNVAKIPAPDACKHCIRLHLVAGPGSPPRVFKMSELIENGSNVGRKAGAWKATVGPVHPWCACELVHVPDGWAFDEFGTMVPEQLTRSELVERNLRKAEILTYKDSVPEGTVAVRISDPTVRTLVEAVVADTPPEIFTQKTGVTLITTDHPRAQNPLQGNDLGYWTGNEIRLMQTIDPAKVDYCVRHEIAHSLNVHLLDKWKDVAKVRAWHDTLFKISEDEGFVSDYAKHEPIENAAEATRVYLYDRKRMMVRWPRQFALLHDAYRDLWSKA